MSETQLAHPEDDARADLALAHADLLELERWRLWREMLSDPRLTPLQVGSGQPNEQTIQGNQQDPFNGLVVLNPTPVTLSLGFQSGMGVAAQAIVPPWTWVALPERHVNLSVATINQDQNAIAPNRVTILQTLVPPDPGAGTYGLNGGGTLQSLAGQSAAGAGLVLDNGAPRANQSLIVQTSAGVTAGSVRMEFSNDGTVFFPSGSSIATAAANTVYALAQVFTARFVRATIATAITGGTINAWIASAGI